MAVRTHSPYRGVTWIARKNCWIVRIWWVDKAVDLVRFPADKGDDAARWSDAARLYLFGNGVKLNFDGSPPEGWTSKAILRVLYNHGVLSIDRLAKIVSEQRDTGIKPQGDSASL